jgi:hypothetical protein
MFFYLDPPIADRVQLGKIGTSSIAANSTQVKTNTIKIPAGTSIYSVHFLVYADSSTSELSYLNNTAVVYNPI